MGTSAIVQNSWSFVAMAMLLEEITDAPAAKTSKVSFPAPN